MNKIYLSICILLLFFSCHKEEKAISDYRQKFVGNYNCIGLYSEWGDRLVNDTPQHFYREVDTTIKISVSLNNGDSSLVLSGIPIPYNMDSTSHKSAYVNKDGTLTFDFISNKENGYFNNDSLYFNQKAGGIQVGTAYNLAGKKL